MDTVFIDDLRLSTVIGVYDWERKLKQQVHLDVEMGADCAGAATSDDIRHALDYKAVAEAARQLAESSECQLLETLAERIAGMLMTDFPVPWLRLKLRKAGAVRGAAGVGVIIERGKRG